MLHEADPLDPSPEDLVEHQGRKNGGFDVTESADYLESHQA
jgi:hypothetical protein